MQCSIIRKVYKLEHMEALTKENHPLNKKVFI